MHAFKAINLHDYNFILDYSWLQVINPDIDWAIKIWKYCGQEEKKLDWDS